MTFFPMTKFCRGYEISEREQVFVKKYNFISVIILGFVFLVYFIFVYLGIYNLRLNDFGLVMAFWFCTKTVGDRFFYRKYKIVFHKFEPDFIEKRKKTYSYIINFLYFFSFFLILFMIFIMYYNGIKARLLLTVTIYLIAIYYLGDARKVMKLNI